MRRRAAIELAMGHLKEGHLLRKNRLKGEAGDEFNVILRAAGMNLHEVAETDRGNFFVPVSVLGLFLPMAVSTSKNVISPSWNRIKSGFFRGD